MFLQKPRLKILFVAMEIFVGTLSICSSLSVCLSPCTNSFQPITNQPGIVISKNHKHFAPMLPFWPGRETLYSERACKERYANEMHEIQSIPHGIKS